MTLITSSTKLAFHVLDRVELGGVKHGDASGKLVLPKPRRCTKTPCLND